MSAFTLIFSGPASSAGQAQNAMVRAGFPALDGAAGTDAHGMPDMIDGSEPPTPQAFLAVMGDDLDGAQATATAYGWLLRACRPADAGDVADDGSDVDARLATIERRLAALEGAR
ncbi:MAG: hypothetical protein JO130_18640 [Solirubrobacterales bacterium]|nr:hypothetical protein [Solirubrobacterales bacterium]